MTIRTHTSVKKTFGRLAMALATATATVGTGSAINATAPPWSHCAYADHPAAADLGPLIPAYHTPPADVQSVLIGTTAVGTDCSIYELPI